MSPLHLQYAACLLLALVGPAFGLSPPSDTHPSPRAGDQAVSWSDLELRVIRDGAYDEGRDQLAGKATLAGPSGHADSPLDRTDLLRAILASHDGALAEEQRAWESLTAARNPVLRGLAAARLHALRPYLSSAPPPVSLPGRWALLTTHAPTYRFSAAPVSDDPRPLSRFVDELAGHRQRLPLAQPTTLAMATRQPVRIRTARGRIVRERDPTRHAAGPHWVVTLPPGTYDVEFFVAEPTEIDVFAVAHHGEPPALDPSLWTHVWLELEWLARFGSREALDRVAAALHSLAPSLVVGELRRREARLPPRLPASAAERSHAGWQRLQALLDFDEGRTEEALSRTRPLSERGDVRAALASWRFLQEGGLLAQAEAMLQRAEALAATSCRVVMARIETGWSRRLLRRRPPRSDLPNHCRQDLKARALDQRFATARGRSHPQMTDPVDLERSGNTALAERAWRSRTGLRAALQLAELYEATDRRPRAHDVRSGAAAHQSTGSLLERVALFAAEPDTDPRRLAPDTDAVLADAAKSGFGLDGYATLLVDYAATIFYPDGSRVVHVHQALRLNTSAAAEALGEAAVPPDAMVLTALTRKPDGRRLEPEDLIQKDALSFPELEPGDILELEYLATLGGDTVGSGAHYASPFLFGASDIPTFHSETVMLFPAARIAEVLFDSTVGAGEPITWNAGAVRFEGRRYRQERIAARSPEPGAPEPDSHLASVAAGFASSHRFVRRHSREMLLALTQPSNAVTHSHRALVDALPADTSERQRIETLFEHVGTSVAESDTWLRVSAAEALSQGRGERVLALYSLLRADGLEPEVALIDPADRPEIKRSLPDPRDYSYPVVTVRLSDGTRLWLDPEFTDAPVGFLPPTVRGRPAQLMSRQGLSETTTPDVDQASETRVAVVDLEVRADGAVIGVWEEHSRGLDAIIMRRRLRGKSGARQRALFADSVQSSLPGASVTELYIDGLESQQRPLTIRAELLVPRKRRNSTHREWRLGLAPLFLGRRWVPTSRRRSDFFADRFEAIELDVLIRPVSGVTLAMEGPLEGDHVRWTSPVGGYERAVRREHRGVRIHKRLFMRPTRIPAAQYVAVSDFARAVDAADQVSLNVRLDAR